MRITWVRIIFVAVANGTISCGVAAQVADQKVSLAVDLPRLVTGQSRIRVRLASGPIVELRDATVDGTSLVGRPATIDSLVRYRVEELEQVWRRGSAAGSGLRVGAGFGFVGGAISGVAVANWCLNPLGGTCAQASGGDRIRAALLGGLVGGVAGGAIGLVIAAPLGRWKTAYQNDRGRVTPIITTRQIGVGVTF